MFDEILGWQRSMLRMVSLAAEAQQVIAYRTMGFGGVWSVPSSSPSSSSPQSSAARGCCVAWTGRRTAWKR